MKLGAPFFFSVYTTPTLDFIPSNDTVPIALRLEDQFRKPVPTILRPHHHISSINHVIAPRPVGSSSVMMFKAIGTVSFLSAAGECVPRLTDPGLLDKIASSRLRMRRYLRDGAMQLG